jgi:site-specific DNA-methyltransferase (adenine-specific)
MVIQQVQASTHAVPTSSDLHRRSIGPATLIHGDAIQGLSELESSSFDLAICDPPYGVYTKADWNLQQDHNLPGFGGAWKLASHQWDKLVGLEGFEFTLRWLSELNRIVRPTGSIWIHATYHNSGMANVACQMLGMEIINEVVWYKRNAFPNLAARRLTASHETILWVHTGKNKRDYRFNYDAVKQAAFPEDQLKKAGTQLRSVWDIPNNKATEELAFGKHPTQKPLRLIERMILASGIKGGSLLVPFMGSGSEMVGALRSDMIPLGFETDLEMYELACKRVEFEFHKEPKLSISDK